MKNNYSLVMLYFSYMSSKSLIWILMGVGSSIGSYIPTLWGAGLFSFSSIILCGIGGFAGIYLGYRLSE
jgi:hypothetical protein